MRRGKWKKNQQQKGILFLGSRVLPWQAPAEQVALSLPGSSSMCTSPAAQHWQHLISAVPGSREHSSAIQSDGFEAHCLQGQASLWTALPGTAGKFLASFTAAAPHCIIIQWARAMPSSMRYHLDISYCFPENTSLDFKKYSECSHS